MGVGATGRKLRAVARNPKDIIGIRADQGKGGAGLDCGDSRYCPAAQQLIDKGAAALGAWKVVNVAGNEPVQTIKGAAPVATPGIVLVANGDRCIGDDHHVCPVRVQRFRKSVRSEEFAAPC